MKLAINSKYWQLLLVMQHFITSQSLHDPRELGLRYQYGGTDLTRETMTLSVISRLASAIAKLNTIAKICKYRRLHERHHFIIMAMEVHGTSKHDMNHFIKECARLFHDKGHGWNSFLPQEGLVFSLFFIFANCASFGLYLAFLFCLPCDG